MMMVITDFKDGRCIIMFYNKNIGLVIRQGKLYKISPGNIIDYVDLVSTK